MAAKLLDDKTTAKAKDLLRTGRYTQTALVQRFGVSHRYIGRLAKEVRQEELITNPIG